MYCLRETTMTAHTWRVGCFVVLIILSVGIALGVGLLLWIGWAWALSVAGGMLVVGIVGYARAVRSKV